jgi:tRNA(Ile)-lysidine synthase
MPPLPRSYRDTRFIRSVLRAIETHRMFQPREAVLIGVSGGPDSVALTHVLLALAPRWGLKLGIAHLNHGLRAGDAEFDEQFVASLAGQLGLPLYIGKDDVDAFRKRRRLSPEEAARVRRHAFLERIRHDEGYRKIALAHHADDNAELVLMYLIRGSGPLGLCAMAPVNERAIVRPLLGVGRREILDFLAANGIDFVTDSSNLQLQFTRNRIRHELIPLLQEFYNPNIAVTVNRLAGIMRSEEEWLEQIISPALAQATLALSETSIRLSWPRLATMHVAQQRRVIRKAIDLIKGDLRRIHLRHVDDVLARAGRNEACGQLDLPDGLAVEYGSDQIRIARGGSGGRDRGDRLTPKRPVHYRYLVSKPEKSAIRLHISETACDLEFSILKRKQIKSLQGAGPNVAFFDLQRLRFPLTIRNPRPGDRFWPLGMKGSQKLSDFFINRKVPRSMRGQTPLLESNGDIIWIAGYRSDHTSRVSRSTTQALKAEFFLPQRQ